ncbi:MAG: nucleotidyltransferase domain-containing protein [Muribaculaceae bacterium]|nr:nucleotidyltransferase domain-containing protein [Muribaculaceae bacterium]
MTNFDIIRNEGRLLYEYIRGSHLYGLNNEDSDVDTSGVYLCTTNELLGCFGYKPQVSDSRHDNTWYEIGELMRLLLKSNPTVLECLFVPSDMILGPVHPLMQMVIAHREQFISKQCFNPFVGYAKSQIEKARGLNKKIVNPVTQRLSPYDFIYTFKGQGSTKFRDWLENRHLHQTYCGLVNVPNMHDIYGVYYDFGAHTAAHEQWSSDAAFLAFASQHFNDPDLATTSQRLSTMAPIGYRGVINADSDSNELRLSSIEDKNARPICFIAYNQSGYSTHCRVYADYQKWVKERNPKRYESNLDKNYDSKNMMHCFRLMHMACEIAEGKGMILRRTWDRQFLMDVRNHKFEYDAIIERLEEEKERMNQLMAQSTIRDEIDAGFVNQLMIDIRKEQLAIANK